MVLLMDAQHRVFFPLLILLYRGQAEEISVTLSVKAKLSDDVVLPCQMDPPMNAFSMTAEWGRPDLRPRFVFVWYNGKELVTDQNEAYSERTSMSTDKLKTGDLSLTLSRVKTSDNGTYRCYIPALKKEYFVDLLVGASSSPAISLVGIDKVSSGVMLDCEAKGLYPEPEVLWLDNKGDILSTDPKKSVEGPDGLVNVSSRVTVTRRHNNVFTCKLQQKSINVTSEAHIHVPDDFFVVPSSSTTSTVFAVMFASISVAALALLVWQWKKKKTEKKKLKYKTEEQLLMKSMKDLEEKKAKLEEEFWKKEEEQKEITHILKTLTELSKELETQKNQLTLMRENAKRTTELRDKGIELVDKEVSQKDGDKTTSRAQGYIKLKEILEEDSWNQQERKKEIEELNMGFHKLMRKTFDDINEIQKKKKKVEDQLKQVEKQIKESENEGIGKETQTV